MYIRADTLDDCLLELYQPLLKAPASLGATRGDTREILGVSIQILRPRARLSRTETRGKPFSALGELLWYLSKENRLDFILPFIPKYSEETEDQVTVYGGYGPRLFKQRKVDQVSNVISKLRNNPNSRRALIQIFNAEDLNDSHKEVPCTTTLQFFVRNELLEMITTMRSNDAIWGLPHDVFCFTMLQEMIARTLGKEIGTYRHFVGSMHLYQNEIRDDTVAAQRFIEERYQSQVEMPAMPMGDPWPSIARVLVELDCIRNGIIHPAGEIALASYWQDIIRLLQVFFAKDHELISQLQREMIEDCYRHYIASRADMKRDDKGAKQ